MGRLHMIGYFDACFQPAAASFVEFEPEVFAVEMPEAGPGIG